MTTCKKFSQVTYICELGMGGRHEEVISYVANLIRGKHLLDHHINHKFIHDTWGGRETRTLRHLHDALQDYDATWANHLCDDTRCDICLRANALRMNPSGNELPRHEGLYYVDVFHTRWLGGHGDAVVADDCCGALPLCAYARRPPLR